jgi:hypothetical protein
VCAVFCGQYCWQEQIVCAVYSKDVTFFSLSNDFQIALLFTVSKPPVCNHRLLAFFNQVASSINIVPVH